MIAVFFLPELAAIEMWVLYTFWNLSQNWHEYNKCLYVILFLKNRSIVSTPCNTCLHELDISYQPSINIYGSCMMHSTSQVRFAGRRSPIAFWASKTSSRLLVCCSCPFSLSPSQSPFFIKTSNYELFMAIFALSSSETKSAINHLNFDVDWSGFLDYDISMTTDCPLTTITKIQIFTKFIRDIVTQYAFWFDMENQGTYGTPRLQQVQDC